MVAPQEERDILVDPEATAFYQGAQE